MLGARAILRRVIKMKRFKAVELLGVKRGLLAGVMPMVRGACPGCWYAPGDAAEGRGGPPRGLQHVPQGCSLQGEAPSKEVKV